LRDIQCSYPGRSGWVRAGGFPLYLSGGRRLPNGRPGGGNDDGTRPIQKSDLFVVARKPVKAGGAKGEMD
jgi:hypothetical protein